MQMFIACDHGGVELKRGILEKKSEISWIDLGTNSEKPVDYPDFAKILANKLKDSPELLGVLICGTGIGISIAANRYPWVRAALVHNELEAKMAKAHNNANVLCFGGRMLGLQFALSLLDAFIETSFEGGRHSRRIAKMSNPTF